MEKGISTIDELISIKDLCSVLSMTRQSLYGIRKNDESFPKPIIQNPQRWTKRSIQEWIDGKSST
jgi:predicted DNA-binding transcriptional regulator AlpA|tara:strand:- start:203 stop:397 length:195 start_codon:yes stop_codon:yes gene_type:complete